MSTPTANGPAFLTQIRDAKRAKIAINQDAAVTVYPTPAGKTHTRDHCAKRRTQHGGVLLTIRELLDMPATAWCTKCAASTPDEFFGTSEALETVFETHNALRRQRCIELVAALHRIDAKLEHARRLHAVDSGVIAHCETLQSAARKASVECVAGLDGDAERRFAAVMSLPSQSWHHVTDLDGTARHQSFLPQPILANTNRGNWGPHRAYANAWTTFMRCIAQGHTYDEAAVKAVEAAGRSVVYTSDQRDNTPGGQRQLKARVSVEVTRLARRWAAAAEANADRPAVTAFIDGSSRTVTDLCVRLLAPYTSEPVGNSRHPAWFANVPAMIIDAINNHLDSTRTGVKQAWLVHPGPSPAHVLRTAAVLYGPDDREPGRRAYERAFELAALLA